MNLFFRYFYFILKNLLFPKPIRVDEECIMNMMVFPNDLDLNFHMNNGRYLTILDIARAELIIKTGLSKLFTKHGYGGVTGAVNISFFKELKPFAKYQVKTKAIYWDNMWFYIEHEFIKDGVITAHAIAKVTFTKKRKRVHPDKVIEILGKDVKKPDPPKYLLELIEGEKDLLSTVKEHNRKLKNSTN